MKSIDIKTTQNVVITYELASARDRVLAFLIDMLIKVVVFLLLLWAYSSITSYSSYYNTIEYFYFIIVLPFTSFYTLAFEIWKNGQTPGKMLLKIKIIKLDGKQPVFYDHLLRWSFRIIDIWSSLGAIAVILTSSSDFTQRLGDMASNCTVVKVSTRTAITLKDIMKIDTIENYTPQYPGIANFREDDILLIKQTIERYNRFRNEAHRNAIVELSANISQKLGLEKMEQDHLKFLKVLIKDYIVLTR